MGDLVRETKTIMKRPYSTTLAYKLSVDIGSYLKQESTKVQNYFVRRSIKIFYLLVSKQTIRRASTIPS